MKKFCQIQTFKNPFSKNARNFRTLSPDSINIPLVQHSTPSIPNKSNDHDNELIHFLTQPRIKVSNDDAATKITLFQGDNCPNLQSKPQNQNHNNNNSKILKLRQRSAYRPNANQNLLEKEIATKTKQSKDNLFTEPQGYRNSQANFLKSPKQKTVQKQVHSFYKANKSLSPYLVPISKKSSNVTLPQKSFKSLYSLDKIGTNNSLKLEWVHFLKLKKKFY